MPDLFGPTVAAQSAILQDTIDDLHAAINVVNEAIAVMPEGPEKVALQAYEAQVDAWHLAMENNAGNFSRLIEDRADLLTTEDVPKARLEAEKVTRARSR